MSKKLFDVEFTKVGENHTCVIIKGVDKNLYNETLNIFPLGAELVDELISSKEPLIMRNEDAERIKEMINALNKLEEEKELRNSRVAQNEKYYTVNGLGIIVASMELGTDKDKERFEAGNYFRDKEDAKVLSEMYKQALEMYKQARG
jgi:hypothetical protein|nr:MAG TPA: hypothetical protein [Caudoviricetes sp.]